jgi:hypothetical protein
MRAQLITTLAMLVGLSVAGPLTGSAQPPTTLSGTWGGERIRVDAGAATVRIQVDCNIARLERAVPLDAAGGFAIEVTFVPLRGVALDGAEERPTSRVTGRLEKDVLQITIGPEGTDPAGGFTLQRNGKATLPNCKMRS